MTIKLQDSVTSRQDVSAAILEIQKYSQWYSQTLIKSRVAGTPSGEHPVISPSAVNLIRQWHEGKQVSQKSLDELVVALEDFVASAPSITITLAAPAPASLKKSLVDWCRKNIAPDVLVDFKFNATMLGGMVVVFGSHVFDWSFKRQILANRSKFPEVLRNV